MRNEKRETGTNSPFLTAVSGNKLRAKFALENVGVNGERGEIYHKILPG